MPPQQTLDRSVVLSWLEIAVGVVLVLGAIVGGITAPTSSFTETSVSGPSETGSDGSTDSADGLVSHLAVVGLLGVAGDGLLWNGLRSV